ncbi:hypothetical protein VDG07_12775 [Xanthomonas campestris pv. raphani]|uniref:hypothetical protein n=1 Tax=Xanthomonas campestris TaxID=339 RepID=UPI002B229262|nr:hypothetical protein [Xanthomonas campestris]MEA9796206.1 hypothetical protein [Xanthomonas campestris pv. raphani]
MTAERAHYIEQDQLLAKLVASVEGSRNASPVEPDIAQRLIEAEAKRQELWQRLNDANCMAINIAAALNLLSAEGSIGREEIPDYVTGTIWLCQGAMNKLAEHLQESV